MGTSKETFPSFADTCEQAWRIEKKRLSITPSQISGTMIYDTSTTIFPKEYEEYTYPYLLSMARKVEQKIFVTKFTTQAPQVSAGQVQRTVTPKIPTNAVEAELKEFVAARQVPEVSNIQEQEKPEMPTAEFQPPNTLIQRNAETLPAPPPVRQYVAQTAQPAQQTRITPPPITKRIPNIPNITNAPPQPPNDNEEEQEVAREVEEEKKLEILEEETSIPIQTQATKEMENEERENPAIAPERPGQTLQRNFADKEEKISAQEEKGSKLRNFISSSKISPRLRKIIEEKLRKEEEEAKVKEKAKKLEPVSLPEPPPEDENETVTEEEIAPQEMPEEKQEEASLQKKSAPRTRKPHSDATTTRKKPSPKKEMDAEEPVEEENIHQEEEEKTDEESELTEEPEEKNEPVEEIEEKETIGEEEEAEMETKEKEPVEEETEERGETEKPSLDEEMPSSLAEQQAPQKISSEKMTIRPLCKKQKQEEEAKDEIESTERLERIQKIIRDLSPNKTGTQEEKIPISKQKEIVKKFAKKAATQIPTPMPQKEVELENEEEPEIIQKKPMKKNIAKIQMETTEEETPEETVQVKPPARKIPEDMQEEEPQKKIEPILPKAAPVKALESRVKRRILPGGIVVEKGMPIKTYVPPARKAVIPTIEEELEEEESKPNIIKQKKPVFKKINEEEIAETQEAEEIPRGAPETDEEEETNAEEAQETIETEQEGETEEITEAKQTEEPEETEEKPRQISQEKQSLFQSKPTRSASTEPIPSQKTSGQILQKKFVRVGMEIPTQEQIAQDERMAKMADKLARIESLKPKEIAGNAEMPSEKEETEEPQTNEGQQETAIKPEEYEKAKENFKHKIEEEEEDKIMKQKAEDMLEQYAKENVVWLYEIYKMGGIARDDFLQKVREKVMEEPGENKTDQETSNPAFANLDKVIDKKKK